METSTFLQVLLNTTCYFCFAVRIMPISLAVSRKVLSVSPLSLSILSDPLSVSVFHYLKTYKLLKNHQKVAIFSPSLCFLAVLLSVNNISSSFFSFLIFYFLTSFSSVYDSAILQLLTNVHVHIFSLVSFALYITNISS